MTNLTEKPLSCNGQWQGGWPQSQEEFECLVETFKNRLVRYVFHRLGNLKDAEEVAQEVFLRAFSERDRHRTVANVSAYLYQMASNLCTDELRRSKQVNVPLDKAEAVSIPSSHPNGFQAAAAAEEIARIEALLRRVTEEQAEVIRLRILDDLGPREIAKILGWRESTVKSRLRHGLEKLREIILREWEESP
ncbi:MAG TPA: RNA polymerase sigma factor [Thermoguttaceae bacterium]